MKPTLQISTLIVAILLFFGSCAEKYRVIKGYEQRQNTFWAGESTTKSSVKTKVVATNKKAVGNQITKSMNNANADVHFEYMVDSKQEDISTKKFNEDFKEEKLISRDVRKIKTKSDKISRFLNKKIKKPIKAIKSKKSNWGDDGTSSSFLLLIGILGVACAILGLLVAFFAWIYRGESLILAIMGIEAHWGIDLAFFLLSLISSIWLIANPTMEDSNILKKVAILFAALPILITMLIIILLAFL